MYVGGVHAFPNGIMFTKAAVLGIPEKKKKLQYLELEAKISSEQYFSRQSPTVKYNRLNMY